MFCPVKPFMIWALLTSPLISQRTSSLGTIPAVINFTDSEELDTLLTCWAF